MAPKNELSHSALLDRRYYRRVLTTLLIATALVVTLDAYGVAVVGIPPQPDGAAQVVLVVLMLIFTSIYGLFIALAIFIGLVKAVSALTGPEDYGQF